jgi:hypothetical protein
VPMLGHEAIEVSGNIGEDAVSIRTFYVGYRHFELRCSPRRVVRFARPRPPAPRFHPPIKLIQRWAFVTWRARAEEFKTSVPRAA